MTVAFNPVGLLERLVERGVFASTVEDYIESTFRRGDKETFYAQTRAKKGRAAAERELTEWAKPRFALAAAIEPIVKGIIALAKVWPESLVDITDCKSYLHSRINDKHGFRRRFVAFNAEAPGCGCEQPKGSFVFGPYGELGLIAVIFEVGRTYRGPLAELKLVLPAWGKAQSAPQKGEIVLAGFDTTGHDSGDKLSPYVLKDGQPEPFTDTDTFLKHLLGMVSVDGISTRGISSGIDFVIGFPGATTYLVAELPKLGDYFAALAEKLSALHTH